jgi:leader peptidase (prepilin peptidase) / N-methyltransferase
MTDAAGIAAFAFIGLAVGSFLNVCIHRLPRGRSIVWPSSRCAACDRPLSWYENIPILSYAALRGRCRTCRAWSSIRYPVVEAITAAAFVLQFLALGWTPLLAVRLLFSAALVVLFAIDFEHFILPDAITIPGILVGLGCAFFLPPGPTDAALGALVGAGVLLVMFAVWLYFRGIEALGMGDVKMMAMVGVFLGLKLTLLTLVLGSFLGSILGILVLLTGGHMKTPLPFGTFLSVAAFIASIYGNSIVSWYVSLYS